jgi:hypothetical protein
MVEYGGKLVGGLRIRGVANQVPQQPMQQPAQNTGSPIMPDDYDDIGF